MRILLIVAIVSTLTALVCADEPTPTPPMKTWTPGPPPTKPSSPLSTPEPRTEVSPLFPTPVVTQSSSPADGTPLPIWQVGGALLALVAVVALAIGWRARQLKK